MTEMQTTGTVAERLLASQREFLSFLERRVGDRAVAEDILQDALIKSIEKEGELRDEGSATAWFYRVLRNAVIDHYRRTGSRSRALEALARELEGAAVAPPDVHAAICECVSRVAETLKSEYADAIRRIEIDGVAVHDFAAEAGITPNNAAVRVYRAREALRKQVKATCGACAEHACVDCSCRH